MQGSLSVKDLRVGDIVHLNIRTDAFQTREKYKVKSKNRYVQRGFQWFEVGLKAGIVRTIWLEWEEDDELEIGLNIRKVSLTGLGLTRGILNQFDRDAAGSFIYQGTEYEFDESGEAVFYRNCANNGIPFHYWDFKDEKGENYIGVERWGPGEYEAFIGIYIEESSIEITRI